MCVCHVVPVSAFSRHETHDIDSVVVAGELLRDACRANLLAPQINLDGVACRPHRNDTSRDGVQLYRNGAVELVYSELLGRSPLDDQKGGRSIFPEEYEIPLVRRGLIALAQTFGSLDVNPPAYLMLSWLVGSEARVAVTHSQYRADFIRLPENAGRISAPPVYLEDFDADPLTVLRPAFDVLWNAVGVAHTQTDFAAADPD